jgi:hypothetical protein
MMMMMMMTVQTNMMKGSWVLPRLPGWQQQLAK